MDKLDIEQPKEIVTTVSARCAHCGTTWDVARIVERKNETGDLVENENNEGPKKCPKCYPNPPAPSVEEES
jgi:hypothetical protein